MLYTINCNYIYYASSVLTVNGTKWYYVIVLYRSDIMQALFNNTNNKKVFKC